MKRILSDNTDVSLYDQDRMIFIKRGDDISGYYTLPVHLWEELKQAIDEMLLPKRLKNFVVD